MVEDRKRAIVETLTALDARMKEVQANSVSVEEAIYQKLEEVLFQLHDETARKVAVLLSEDMELRRQLEFLNWSDSFVTVLEVRVGFGGDLGERSCGKSERVGVCALTLPEVWHVRVSAHTAVLYALLICLYPWCLLSR